ncbi:Wzz/FepE/Etk N-terminal domain-containing protein, partial [Escherichia coli]|nr:Wzz/FepE/Etk N-terminal domain-containing protein [Escherichia coli]
MSSLNIKQGSDAHFPEYPLASPSNNEIDLLNLIAVLWRAKKTVMAVIFAFACAGLLISFILPQKWTSAAVVTPPEPVQWQELEKTFTKEGANKQVISSQADSLIKISRIWA